MRGIKGSNRHRVAKKIVTKRPRVIALLPAHNEQTTIAKSLDSLLNQSWPLTYILVIADNCNDNTIRIVKKYQKKYGCQKIRLLKTKNNNHKKAGALNQGFLSIKYKPDFIFGMDADTVLDQDIIAAGVRQLQKEPKTGGICSAYRTLPIEANASSWERFLWRLQNIEFGLANAWRVENYNTARVLPGVAVIFRTRALKDVELLHAGTIWATDSLVEDYRLTLELKDRGWNVKSSLAMISWSDVPLRILGKGGLFDQRQRWYSGTVDEIRRRGFKKHSRYEAFTIGLLSFNFLMRLLLYATYVLVFITGSITQLISIFLLVPFVASMVQFYRWSKYADQKDYLQALMTIILIPNEIYSIFKESIYVYSIWLSYRRPNRAW